MNPDELQVQKKKELDAKQERTKAGRYYVPNTDIYESSAAILVTVEMPGVRKENVDIKLDKNVLTITGNVDFSQYEGLEPVYTEYNVGNYTRSFTLSSAIDRDRISAKVDDGVLSVELPKVKEATSRRIEVR